MRNDVPLIIKNAWQTAFSPENIKGAFKAAGISPLTGIRAVPKEKLSPNLAVRAAACDPTAHLTSFGESSTPTLPAVLSAPKRRLDLHKHGLSRVEKLQIENRELKRALCALKVVEQLHPEQVGKKNATEHQPRRAGIIRAAGAQHATADEWIRTMEEEDALQEQKKQEAEQRSKAREEQRVQRAQERSAKQQCSAVFKSGKRKGQQCTAMCLPNANAQLILLPNSFASAIVKLCQI